MGFAKVGKQKKALLKVRLKILNGYDFIN